MTNSDSGAQPSKSRSQGLLASLQRLLGTSVEVLRTRVEILSTELEEEGIRVRELFILQQVSLFFLGLGLLLATILIVQLFWDSYRLTALAAFALLYLLVGFISAWVLKRKLRNRPPLFSASLAELRKDVERLESGL
ncbi:phage holin family protein [uncultured Amphritea sp.]|uniref:phage holin family protein n=1 Tax=uncultured Amphritea sp. TaxID=981605 RepID=UPI00261037F5|nr:phage holin family protein [uncultured Amphritea sp.]